MLRSFAACLLAVSLHAQPLVIRPIAEIPPPTGDGATGRLLMLDRRGDETIAIRARLPFFDRSLADLAATRIAADGTTRTTPIAPLDVRNDIRGGDGATTSNGYLVAWHDGGVHEAFIDASLRLRSVADLPAYAADPSIAVRCTTRRCLVAWFEADVGQVFGSLLDTEGNVLRFRLRLGIGSRNYSLAASSSQFMIATDDDVLSIDENGNAVVLLHDTTSGAQTIDVDGDEFVVFRARQLDDDRSELLAEAIPNVGTIQNAWWRIAVISTPPISSLYAGHSREGRLLLLESTAHVVCCLPPPPTQISLRGIRLGLDFRQLDDAPFVVAANPDTNESPKIIATSSGYLVGWSHGAAPSFLSNDSTRYSPRLEDIPSSSTGGRALYEGPTVPRVVATSIGRGAYAVLWYESSLPPAISALSLSIASRSHAQSSRIVLTDDHASDATIAFDGSEWLVAWSGDEWYDFVTRTIGIDGSLGEPLHHPGRHLFSDLTWDGVEYLAMTYGEDGLTSLKYEAFDEGGRSLPSPRANARLASLRTYGDTRLEIRDSANVVITSTRLSNEPADESRVITRNDRFVIVLRKNRQLSFFEVQRDGHLMNIPFTISLDSDETLGQVVMFGTGYACLTLNRGGWLVRMVDLDSRAVSDPIPLAVDGDRFARADAGLNGSVVLLLLRTVRGKETEGASIIVHELLPRAINRRRSFQAGNMRRSHLSHARTAPWETSPAAR